MSVLGEEGRVIGNGLFQAKVAEPAITQVQMEFLAQSAFGADAIAVVDDQHADHQLRINRGAAGVAVVLRQMLAQSA